MPYYNLNYSKDFKYYIDESSLSSLSNTEKQIFIKNVEEAVGIWNSATMGYNSEQIVALTRVYSYVPISVCKVKYGTLESGVLGKFNPATITITLNEYTVSTVAHELGHFIGLQDLDYGRDNPVHTSLMGYRNSSDMRISYHDIVGVAAILQNPRSCHLKRYIKNGDDYIHICFDCDLRVVRSAPISGSQPMIIASSCSHTYDRLVSADNRHWFKCTKCYKVIESDFYVVGTNDSLEIIGLVDESKEKITIPKKISGQIVKTINAYAFSGNKNLSEVTFSKDGYIEKIEESAFSYCSNLKNINGLPSTLIEIGKNAFNNCRSLVEIYIPSAVRKIGEDAFFYCDSLLKVNFGMNSQLKSIEARAFQWCTKLLSFSIPSGVTHIGSSAFSLCTGISNITVPNSVVIIESKAFESWKINQVIYVQNRLLPPPGWSVSWNSNCSAQVVWLDSSYTMGLKFTAITDFNQRPISYRVSAGNSLDNSEIIVIPAVYGGLPVTTIATGAFADQSELKAISIPNSVIYINMRAFSNCVNLNSVTIQSNSKLQIIGGANVVTEGAFYGCSSLKDFTVPNSVTQIQENAFSYSGLTRLTFEDKSELEELGYMAFAGCEELVAINIPNNLTKIGNNAFYSCKGLIEVAFEENSRLSTVGKASFANCSSLVYINLPESVSVIEDLAFMWCTQLKSIKIPNKVQVLKDSTFANCSALEYVFFSKDSELTNIGFGVFSYCSNLTSIVIPKGVEAIDTHAFNYCSSLNMVYYSHSSLANWEQITIATAGNSTLINSNIYLYSDSLPHSSGLYWHYVDEEIYIWN